jgi:hypothetical protein
MNTDKTIGDHINLHDPFGSTPVGAPYWQRDIPNTTAIYSKPDSTPNPPNNIELYEQIVNELKQIYKDKNHDYGNSFSILFEKFGLTSVVIRLWDKILRLETLTKTEAKVKDESITDTLKDIINYSIMTLIELEKHKGEIIK